MSDKKALPKIGFLGVGWIGKSRLQAIAEAGAGEIAAFHEPNAETADALKADYPQATACATYEQLLKQDIDAVAIATPSAQHAQQTAQAIAAGKHVFCQKPLARTTAETKELVAAAKAADVHLGVDFSYRDTKALQAVQQLVQSGDLGTVYAAELVFHNAYGPDKGWYYDSKLAGGGCLMDLGIHLIDALFFLFPSLDIREAKAKRFSKGSLVTDEEAVEDFAHASISGSSSSGELSATLATSWNLPAGQEAAIGISVYGSSGGAQFTNLNGSFYHFEARHLHGTSYTTFSAPPDNWSGRTAAVWAEELQQNPHYNPKAEQFVQVAQVLDSLYER
jgi:predicted dehydrogenase